MDYGDVLVKSTDNHTNKLSVFLPLTLNISIRLKQNISFDLFLQNETPKQIIVCHLKSGTTV